MNTLWLAGAFSHKAAAHEAARSLNGHLLTANSNDTGHLPFAALVLCATDDIKGLQSSADVGCYLVTERTIRNLSIKDLDDTTKPGVAGIFTMVAHPDIGPDASDAHWRDNHAPLALEIHEAMTHYYQLSVQHCFSGPDNWNGFALCCFATEDDLRHKFFNSPEGERRINEDVMKFADVRKSPRRVISELNLGSDPNY